MPTADTALIRERDCLHSTRKWRIDVDFFQSDSRLRDDFLALVNRPQKFNVADNGFARLI